MSSWRPELARPAAVAIAGTVDHDDTEAFREPVDEAAHGEILDHCAVAMNEHQGLTLTALDVVQTHTIHGKKAPDWRVLALRVPYFLDVPEGSSRESGGASGYRWP